MTTGKASEPPYFNPKATSSVTLYTDVGQRADRPFMVLATFSETSLGDLISKISFVTSLKDQFEHARLIVRFNDFRPYSSGVVSLSPNIDHAEALHGEAPNWMGRFLRDTRLWRPLSGSIKHSNRRHEAFYDLVVVDSMANARTVHAFEPTTPLRVLTNLHEPLTRQLTSLGLDPNQCFAVIHCRDGTYSLKSRAPIRNGNPESYRQAIDHIIDQLNCQVVTIGHPGMTLFPSRAGLVDLSQIKGSFMLQAFAVSRARFMIGGASGPIALGWAFDVPTGTVDCAEVHAGWGSGERIFLTHMLETPDGRKLQNNSLAESGLLDVRALAKTMRENSNYRMFKNSGDDISAVATHLFERSTDVSGWRPDPAPRTGARPNALSWPPRQSAQVSFFEP